jgi:MFS transporter, MHS family, shikimate and dehydroshikimate transport protein
VIAMVLAMNFGHDMMYGPMAATLSELFGTHVRYSGASLVYQLTSVVSGGVAPFIATLLLARYGSPAVAGYMAACCVVTIVATLFLPETHRVQLDGAVSGTPNDAGSS